MNYHFQELSDEAHLKLEHELETAMNDAYDEAESDWVMKFCKRVGE